MTVSSINVVKETERLHPKRIKLGHYLTLYTKVNSKWIKDLNVRSESIKLLEENTGSKLFNISLSDDFLDLTPRENTTKGKINKWNCIKLKASAQQRNHSQNERKPTE